MPWGAKALNDNGAMPARLTAFLVWALVAASVVAWGLRLLTRAPTAPAHTISVGDSVAMNGDLTRLFGAQPVEPVAAAPTVDLGSRFRLTGVLAPKPPNTHGVALIAVDGKMPRAYGVGSVLDGDLVLQSVALRSATIGPRGSTSAAVLQLPPPPTAATGNLPAAAGISSAQENAQPAPPPAALPPVMQPPRPPPQAMPPQQPQPQPQPQFQPPQRNTTGSPEARQ